MCNEWFIAMARCKLCAQQQLFVQTKMGVKPERSGKVAVCALKAQVEQKVTFKIYRLTLDALDLSRYSRSGAFAMLSWVL